MDNDHTATQPELGEATIPWIDRDQFTPPDHASVLADAEIVIDHPVPLSERSVPGRIIEPQAPVVAPPARSTVMQQAQIRAAYARLCSTGTVSRMSPGLRRAKRTVDLTLSLPALILLAPLFLIIAVLIRLDSPGPAFFIQHRVGEHGRLFRMLKFRTMTNGCGLLIGPEHKVQNDARVTRIGRFLRQTSIDELPQLINVVLGQMSLVGPRPEIPEIVIRKYETWQYERLAVPQGITGWWQITGRGTKLLCNHTEDDLFYIRHQSFWFDLKILLITARAVISRRGAF